MTEEKKNAAALLAMADKVANGDDAKPSSCWGVAPTTRADSFDASMDELQKSNPKALADLFDRLSGEVK